MTATLTRPPALDFTDDDLAEFHTWTPEQLARTFFTREQVASIFNITTKHLAHLIAEGRLPTFNRIMVDGRHWYPKAHVREMQRRPEFLRFAKVPREVYVDEYEFLASICGPTWAFHRVAQVYYISEEYLKGLLTKAGHRIDPEIMGAAA
ncbi:hypothetical protein [Corynebacterium sp.]|uniref:hypothetical protein n=1 Tax=Corynebacterium sp. TaxID=1720 RepID=UPI002A91E5A6|nr:hypothetical protein [Corynebacterium sp.]MDY5785857.1 hypothetical protein [Corynebacterium sp.]